MGQIKIVNLKDQEFVDFICDRRSPLGNPHKMQQENERNLVCRMYETTFNQNLNPDYAPPGWLEYLDAIIQKAKQQDITLGCWCAPKQCHCDTIKKYVESQLPCQNKPKKIQ